ncbi:uncharacterized protein BP5553_04268 [Venustampulla echinocandica]|uniref:Uncharacterized protein n=1 Tax=Venustampulla echinocandica TaxID=2656787 RepID=A0A370TWS7_9HELO|nr:uncharacterized protein BP5553_04268 [Venustampulla echinocandica]RDL39928.1 hypothetical protein BP5553_04268 [Venustampulla echinocandica]
MAVETSSVADLVVQLHSNIDSIHKCVESLSDTKGHDELMEQLETQREAELEALRTKHENDAQELAVQRAKLQQELEDQRRREEEELIERRRREDEERRANIEREEEARRRVAAEEDGLRKLHLEEEQKTLHMSVEEKLEQLDDEMEKKVEDGKRMLQELDEKRKAINAQIDAALNKPTVIPVINFRSRAKTLRQPAKSSPDMPLQVEPSIEAKDAEHTDGAEPVINGAAHQPSNSKAGGSDTVESVALKVQESSDEDTRQVSPAEHTVEHQAETQTPIEDVSETQENKETTVASEVNGAVTSDVDENTTTDYTHDESEHVGQNKPGAVSAAEIEEPEHPSKSTNIAQYEESFDDSQEAAQAPSTVEELNVGAQEPLGHENFPAHGGDQPIAEAQRGNEDVLNDSPRNDESPTGPFITTEDISKIDGSSPNDKSFSHEGILSNEITTSQEKLNCQTAPKDVEVDNQISIDTSLNHEQSSDNGSVIFYDEHSSPTESAAHETTPAEIEQSPIPRHGLNDEKSVTAETSSVDEEPLIREEYKIYHDSMQESEEVAEETLNREQPQDFDGSVSYEGSVVTARENISSDEDDIPLEEKEGRIPDDFVEEKDESNGGDHSSLLQENIVAAESKSIGVSATEELTEISSDNGFKNDLVQERGDVTETEGLQPESGHKEPATPDIDSEEADGSITPTAPETISERPATPVANMSNQTNSQNIEESPATVLNTDDLFADDDDEEDQPEEHPEEAAAHTTHSKSLESMPDLSNGHEQAPENAAIQAASKTLEAVLQDNAVDRSPVTVQQSRADHPSPGGVFASLVDAIRPDISLVRELGDTSNQAPHDQSTSQADRYDFSHNAPNGTVQDEYLSDEESLLHHAAPSNPSKYPALHESDVTFHIRTHTADTVPSFETYAHSDDADSTPTTPIDEILDIAQEVLQNEHLISSSWPEGRSGVVHMHEQEQDLKSQASPLQAGFEPYSPRLYSGVVTPKSSRVDLNSQESPESMIHSSPEVTKDQEYDLSKATRTPGLPALDTSQSPHSLDDGYYDPPLSKTHSLHEDQPSVEASADRNPITSPSLPNSSFFQRTRSLFESSSAQAVRSVPSAASLSKLVGVGSAGLKDSIHNPAREEKAPLLGGADGDGY